MTLFHALENGQLPLKMIPVLILKSNSHLPKKLIFLLQRKAF